MVFSLAKQALRSLVVLFVVTFATFCLMYGNGEGIARTVLGLSATPEAVQAKVHELGLDRSLIVQYGDWVAGVVRGDLGASFYTSEPVASALQNRVPVTMSIVLITLLLTAVLSVLLGVTAAVRGGVVDRVLQVVSVLGTAISSFIVAIALVFAFAIQWRVFPATGYVPSDVSLSDWASSLVLPVLALLIGSVASAAQQFRTAVLDTMGRDFVRTLRARGVKERHVIFRHVLRNSAAPGLTVLSLTVFGMLGGAVFIEQVFALPGIGQLATSAATINDVPMVMGTVLVTIVIVLVVNILGDVAVAFLNPKARH